MSQTKPLNLSTLNPDDVNAVDMFTNRKNFDDLRDRLSGAIEAFSPRLDTKKGRDEIASFAHKIAKVKTRVDKAGKDLGEEARATVNRLNAARREYTTELQAMQDKVRAPLTEWEAEEKRRTDLVVAFNKRMNEASVVRHGESSDHVKARIEEIKAEDLDPDIFRDQIDSAKARKASVVNALKSALSDLVKREEERAELERLKAEKAEREAEERRKAQAQERAERETLNPQLEASADAIGEPIRSEDLEIHTARDGVTSPNQPSNATQVEAAKRIQSLTGLSRSACVVLVTAIARGKVPGISFTG